VSTGSMICLPLGRRADWATLPAVSMEVPSTSVLAGFAQAAVVDVDAESFRGGHLRAAGPQSMLEVWTVSGTRKLARDFIDGAEHDGGGEERATSHARGRSLGAGGWGWGLGTRNRVKFTWGTRGFVFLHFQTWLLD